MDRMADRCKNTTFATPLRTVIKVLCSHRVAAVALFAPTAGFRSLVLRPAGNELPAS